MYQADPSALPDDQFTAGDLRWLVPGNRGRLLDARRTPVRVTAIDLPHGYAEIEICAFEDAGARWLVPLEEVTRYQFAPGGRSATAAEVAAMRAAIDRLDVTIKITPDEEDRRSATAQLAAARARADAWLDEHGVPGRLDVSASIESRRGLAEAAGWLRAFLTQAQPAGLADMDEELAAGYVSNPGSGDLVRAHLITAARLGLCDYQGKAIRDPASMSGARAEDRRAAHLLARAGFTQALWRRADSPGLMIYRGIGLQGRAALQSRPASLISATFSRAVADSHFSATRAESAALLRRRLPADRLLMTFLETPAMNRSYLEAEAVVFADGGLL